MAHDGEADAARRIVERIKKGDLPREGFGTRDVWRRGWSGVTDQKRVAAGLDLLVELGQLEAWQEPTRTKPRTLYFANPKATRRPGTDGRKNRPYVPGGRICGKFSGQHG